MAGVGNASVGVFVGVGVGVGTGVGQVVLPITVALPFWLAAAIGLPAESARLSCVTARPLVPPQKVAKRIVASTPVPLGPAAPVSVQPNWTVPVIGLTLGPRQNAAPPVLSRKAPLSVSM